MKKIALMLVLNVFGLPNGYCEFDLAEAVKSIGKPRKEIIAFNATVTDEEIIEYLEFQYEIDPDMLKQLRDTISDPKKLKTFLSNYRKPHNEAGVKLPTLRGLSEKEISELRAILEFKKEEYYEAEDAEKKLQSLSQDQLATIAQEGAKLIESYDTLQQESSERMVIISDNFPSRLNFLELRMIYLTDTKCRLYLQKGMGKGIGFSVSNEKDEWKLWSFNEYKSWEQQEVKMQ